MAQTYCTQQVGRFEQALRELTGQTLRVEFHLLEGPAEPAPAPQPLRVASPHQLLAEVAKHPLVHRAGELFGAQPVRVDEPPEKRGKAE